MFELFRKIGGSVKFLISGKRVVWRNEELKRFKQMWLKGYSPLNFDADSFEDAIKMAKNLLKLFPRDRIQMRISSSGKGVHFRIVDENGNQVYMRSWIVFDIRGIVGDDPGRLYWDSFKLRFKKWRPISVLFNSKNGKRAREWECLNLNKLYRLLRESRDA